jgi:hypothetical protein
MRKIANVFTTFMLLLFITACEKESSKTDSYNYIKYEYSFLHSPIGIRVTTYANDSDNNTYVYSLTMGKAEFYTGLVKKGFEAKMKTIITENISGVKEFYITQNIYGSNDNNNFKLIKSNFKTLTLNDSAELSYIVE